MRNLFFGSSSLSSMPTAPPSSAGGQGLLEFVVAGFRKRDAEIAGLASCLTETQGKVARLEEDQKKESILLNFRSEFSVLIFVSLRTRYKSKMNKNEY